MKALSLWQPWATLIALGVKRFETLAEETSWRGQVAVYGKELVVRDVEPAIDRILVEHFGRDWHRAVPRGAVVATAVLVDCRRTVDARRTISDLEDMCGDWSSGRYAWQLEHVLALAEPIYWRSPLGLLFEVPREIFDTPPPTGRGTRCGNTASREV